MFDHSIITEYQHGIFKYEIKYLDEDCYAILRDGESIHGTCTAEDVMRHMAGIIENLNYLASRNDPQELY